MGVGFRMETDFAKAASHAALLLLVKGVTSLLCDSATVIYPALTEVGLEQTYSRRAPGRGIAFPPPVSLPNSLAGLAPLEVQGLLLPLLHPRRGERNGNLSPVMLLSSSNLERLFRKCALTY